ncbi:MAG TPA: sigma-54 dependent transcriptional regulator [Candidatus Binataceae bacterium]|nr:sigma-54 dependent transcriptional regulator [Candidatus Binataceae bacterium]
MTELAPAKSLIHRDPPRHFHLLWDEDLDDLREVLTAVREHRSEVVSTWYELYQLHFGDRRTLSEAEFRKIFEPAILRNQEFLLRKDMDGYARGVLKLGEELAEHHVPLQEIIASMHLFEEAAQSVFPKNPPPATDVYNKFDKLSHIRIILLVDCYSRSQWAAAATRIHALEMEAKYLPVTERTRFHGLVGRSTAMRELYRRIEAVGRARAIALVVGESGTGKELVARAVHECGPNPTSPFVPLNCAALPKELIESELFGYKRGAFTGANTEYLGLFRAAEGGTLFLDEITEMNPDTQSKLLRAIQERRVRPVGSSAEVAVDARVIASTNREPDRAMQEGRLRNDLYYRLQASVLRVPPLRERIEDIPLLVQHFIDLFNEKRVRPTTVHGIEDSALKALQDYSWPGNVRELSNAIEGAFIFGASPMIELANLPPAIGGRRDERAPGSAVATPMGSFAEAEREIITRALAMAEGNKVHAARALKISRKRLYAKIEKYGLQ